MAGRRSGYFCGDYFAGGIYVDVDGDFERAVDSSFYVGGEFGYDAMQDGVIWRSWSRLGWVGWSCGLGCRLSYWFGFGGFGCGWGGGFGLVAE